MHRKWKCERNARGPRGPPGGSPLSAPVRPFVRTFSNGWPPCPSQPRNRPVAACEPSLRRESEECRTAGTREKRGKKTVRDKERGSRCVPRSGHTAPQCGSGQRFAGILGRGSARGYVFGLGVQIYPRMTGTARCSRIFRGSRRGYG